PRAIGLVEGEQCIELVVAREFAVAVNEIGGERTKTAPIEVHREERDVRRDVAATQPRGELDAIEDREAPAAGRFGVGLEAEVRRMEVAVAVADAAARDAVLENRAVLREETRLRGFEEREEARGERVDVVAVVLHADEGSCLLDVL